MVFEYIFGKQYIHSKYQQPWYWLGVASIKDRQ